MKKTIALSLALTVVVSSATAQFSTSFEAPDYALGGLTGQQGWTSSGNTDSGQVLSSAEIAAYLTDNGFDASQPTAHGSQAFLIAAPASGAATTYYHQALAGLEETPVVVAQWSYRATGSSPNANGTWFVLDNGTNSNRAFAVRVRNANAADGFHALSYYSGGGWQETGIQLDYDSWYDLKVIADYSSQTYQVFFNGTEVTAPGGVDFWQNSEAATRLTIYRGGNDAGAFYDDISVDAVPEPATMALLGAGALAMLRRRKK